MFKPLELAYKEDIAATMQKEFSYGNVMEIPKIEKIVINVGLGEALDNAKAVECAVRDIEQITGQKAVLTKAKTSIAGFKLREGRVIGVKVTLRGKKMWAFLQRLIHLALPRTRDFQGVNGTSFDGRGNYTLGLPEQLIFPEINYDKIDKVRGLSISIVTTAETDEEGRRLLALFGMPFKHDN